MSRFVAPSSPPEGGKAYLGNRTSQNSVNQKFNVVEFYKGEVRRIPIPRTPVNNGMKEKKGRDIVAHILASSK